MNNNQKEIYNEWKRLESEIRLEVSITPLSGTYTPPGKSINNEDFKKLLNIRKLVWKELQDFLSDTEKFDLSRKII